MLVINRLLLGCCGASCGASWAIMRVPKEEAGEETSEWELICDLIKHFFDEVIWHIHCRLCICRVFCGVLVCHVKGNGVGISVTSTHSLHLSQQVLLDHLTSLFCHHWEV